MVAKSAILAQIDSALSHVEGIGKAGALSAAAIAEAVTVLRATIERLAAPGSSYVKNASDTLQRYGSHHDLNIEYLLGIVRALRHDYEAGQVQPIHELVHADVFGDFLEMAEHLLSERYKDAAAVIAGSTLEEHLRKLAEKHGIAVAKDDGRAKKADLLNVELRGADVYQTLDQKSVTAWLDLRNNAAHGKYGMYLPEQVALMVQGVRDFMVRHPA